MVTVGRVWHAYTRIREHIRTTPLEYSSALSRLFGETCHLKLENLQNTGSFKIRGAANKMLTLREQELAAGVICASSGNHARAVAHMAAVLGANALVVVPFATPKTKVNAVRDLGAQVIVQGDSYDEAERYAWQLQRETGRVFIHAFTDPDVIAGQGSVALEIMQQLPQFTQVVVPAGGGGLITGMAVALKNLMPHARIIGVSSEASPSWPESRRASKVVSPPVLPTLADGTAGDIAEYTFNLAAKYVDEFILVREASIAHAIRWMATEHHQIIEGAAALALAAALEQHPSLSKVPTIAVLTGQNIDMSTFCECLDRKESMHDSDA